MLKWLDGREEWSWSEEEGESAGRRRNVVGRRLIHHYALVLMILCYCFCMFCVWHMYINISLVFPAVAAWPTSREDMV